MNISKRKDFLIVFALGIFLLVGCANNKKEEQSTDVLVSPTPTITPEEVYGGPVETIEEKVTMDTGQSYKMNQYPTLSWEGLSTFRFKVMQNGNLFCFSYYSGEVLGKMTWNGNKWKLKKLDNFATYLRGNKNEVCDYTEEGYFYTYQNSTIYEVKENGKVLNRCNIKKHINWNSKMSIKDCIAIGNHKVLLTIVYEIYNKKGVDRKEKLYQFNLKTGKMICKYKKVSDDWATPVLVKDNKMYFFPKIYNNGENKDLISVRDLKSGEIIETIDASAIRANIPQEDEFYLDEYGYMSCESTIEHQYLHLDIFQGELYAAYITGVYKWNKKVKSWDMLVDASKDNSDLSHMQITDFKVGIQGEFYFMGIKDEVDDEEASTFIVYKMIS